MSSTVSFNGSTYIIPATGDTGWGSNVSNYLIAIAAGCLQKTGGAFTLSAETDFGASFGLKSLYYKSRSANVATSGQIRLNNNSDSVAFRNFANTLDLYLQVDTSNRLIFNGTILQPSTLTSAHIFVGNASNLATDVAMSGNIGIDNTGNTTIQSGVIVNSMISAAAAIAITKIANGTANQLIGANSGASANEYKTLSGTTSQVVVTNGTGTITLSTPQNIDTAANVQFGSLALGGTLDTSSILSLTSTTKGFLPPVMTTTQKNAISTPTNGLVVYDSSLAQLFLRSGGSWTPLSTGGGSGTVSSGTANQLAYYASTGTTVAGLTAITASRALASDVSGLPVASTTLATELAFVSGVTSAIQTQLNLKAPIANPAFTGAGSFAGTLSVGTLFATNRAIFVDASSVTTAGSNPKVWFGGGSGGVGAVSEIGFTYSFTAATYPDTFTPITIGYQSSSGSGSTMGDIVMCTRSVTTDTAPTERLRVLAAGSTKLSGNLSFNATSTQGIVGTTTNDSAAAGNVGEAVRAQTNGINLSTSGVVYADALSISLTAGDWDISFVGCGFSTGTTFTQLTLGIGTVTGNSNTGTVLGDNATQWYSEGTTGLVGGKGPTLTVAGYRVSITSTTTYYLKMQGIYTGTIPQVIARMSARRIR